MTTQTQDGDGVWRPSIPLPLYVRSWRTLFRWRYRCRCGVTFHHEAIYRLHYLDHTEWL